MDGGTAAAYRGKVKGERRWEYYHPDCDSSDVRRRYGVIVATLVAVSAEPTCAVCGLPLYDPDATFTEMHIWYNNHPLREK